MFSRSIKAARRFGNETVERARRNLNTPGFGGQPKGRKKSNTGKLANSLGWSIRETKGFIIIEFKSSEDYAAIVEEGRDKGAKMPPAGAIDKWVTQRNIKGTRDSKGRFTPRKKIVFMIRRSISQEGIKGVPFFSEAMNESFERLPEIIREALINDLDDFIFNNFTKKGYNVNRN